MEEYLKQRLKKVKKIRGNWAVTALEVEGDQKQTSINKAMIWDEVVTELEAALDHVRSLKQ